MGSRATGRPRRLTLLLGTALSAVPTLGGARAAAPFTAAWFAQHGGGGGNAADVAAARAQSANTPAHLAQVQQSLDDLQKSAAALAGVRQLQAAAHAVAAAGAVPNGLVAGGLVPDSGLAAPGLSNPVATWSGAAAPVQTGAASAPTVTVRQSAPTALLNWQSFNVGARTTLHFDQSAGGAAAAGWVVLNRVGGATASTILGSIDAPGHVLILNNNGILFGAGATVNVGALVASTATISPAQFATAGIYGAAGAPSFTGATADVTVAAGAAITATAPLTATSAGGGVILLGRNVANAGAITTPGGQTILGAGENFELRPGYSVSGTGTATLADSTTATALIGNTTSTTLGSEIAVTGAGGAATNTGAITSTTGDITLVGHAVTQAGVAIATTSLSQRGTIHLLNDLADTTGSVTLAPGSVTTVVPDAASEDATDAQLETDIANSALANEQRAAASRLNNETDAADNQWQSRVEITTGGTILFAANSLTTAQGGQIVATAPGRIETAPGSILDVSGTVGVTLPMSVNDVTVDVQGFQLRDDPENRDTGRLANATVTVDTRDLVDLPADASADQGSPYTGADRLYTAGGLLEVSGEVGNVEHTIGEFTAAGGSILLSTGGAATGAVVAQGGSVFNLAGGTITYQAGLLPQSWLIGPNGVLYNVNTAPGTLTYAGVYDGIQSTQRRWNVSENFRDPLIAPAAVYQTGYTIGRDAGTLTVSAPTVLFGGTVDAGAVNGPGQSASPNAATAAVLRGQTALAQGGGLLVGLYDLYGLEGGFASTVTLGAGPVAAADAVAAGTAVPDTLLNQVDLDATALSADGLGQLAITTEGGITVAAPVTLAGGGALTLLAPAISVGASLTAHGGTVSLGDLVTRASPVFAPTGSTVSLNTGGASAAAAAGGDASGLSFVLLAPGAALDVSGTFTNALRDPQAAAAGGANEAGGTVGIDTTGGILLSAGSLIDATGGALVGSTGAVSAARGGSVSIIGDDPNAIAAANNTVQTATVPAGPVTLAGAIEAVGSTGGGAFTLRAPSVLVSAAGGAGAGRTLVSPSLFSAGFSAYTIDGYGTDPALPGVEVAAGTAVDPVVPVYALDPSARLAPTGTAAASLFATLLPPLYAADQVTATLAPRAGASLALESAVPVTATPTTVPDETIAPGGAVLLDAGASITVDPAQTVTLSAIGQLTVDGRITAHGGAITLENQTYEPGPDSTVLEYVPGQSVWVGGGAVLDVSGVAATATDLNNRLFGEAPSGGTIRIGGAAELDGEGAPESTSAVVVVRPGAVLDADGSATVVDATAGQSALLTRVPLPLAGSGGTIDVNSATGIALDGTMTAAAGGPDAAGGTLVVDLVHPRYGASAVSGAPLTTIPEALETPYQVVVSQNTVPSGLAAGLQPTDPAVDVVAGTARVGAAAVTAGGFGTLTIGSDDYVGYGPDVLRFDGDVTLRTGESLSLPAVLGDTDPGASVVLAAPVVTLNSNASTGTGTNNAAFPYALTTLRETVAPSTQATAATLLIETHTAVIGIGTAGGIDEAVPRATDAAESDAPVLDVPGFAQTTIAASGDAILAPVPAGYPANVSVSTFATNGNLTIESARLYVSGPPASRFALSLPLDAGAGSAPGGLLLLERTPGTVATPPLVVDTGLTLSAATILQGGAIEQPFGTVTLGSTGGVAVTDSVQFLPGSITSVSGDGLSVLFGGTTDGVNDAAGGTSLTFSSTQTPVVTLAPTITLAADSIGIDAGAVLDLRGGGTLQGAGFNSGRGGSTDVLVTPLTRFSGGTAAQPADAIYAVIPGYAGATPLATDTLTAYTGAADAPPPIGTTITLTGAAGGLPAGTYTLLPAYDALLPGGFRIELTGATATLPVTQPIGNLTTQTAALIGLAGTNIRSSVPVVADITSGTAVRDLSSYDEEDYGTYVTTVARTFGISRFSAGSNVGIPADSGTLVLDDRIPVPLAPAAAALSVAAGGSVLFAPGPGGTGGIVSVQTQPSADTSTFDAISIVAGSAPAPDAAAPATLVLGATDLSRLGANSLYLGASLTRSEQLNGETVASYAGQTSAITVGPGAVLAAGEVVLAADDAVTVDRGAVIDTVGGGSAAYTPPAATLVTNAENQAPTQGPALLVVSNAGLTFATPASTSAGTITVADGATLASAGSIGFVTAGTVEIGETARLATTDLSLALATLNITGGTGLPAGVPAPTGVTLTQGFLDNLLTGAGGLGPPLGRIVLTASQAIDFYGSVSLALGAGGGSDTLELNTPTIEGYGAPGDVARVSAGTVVWNGIAAGAGTGASALAPVPPVAGGAGTGSGTLAIAADTIVLGYGPDDAVPTTGPLVLPREALGFSTVALDASGAVVANGSSSLAVYRTQGAWSGTGYANSGGALAVSAPLVTADAGTVLQLAAGGPVTFAGTGGAAGAAAGLGGEIDVTGATIAIGDTVALPEGRLTLTAAGPVALGPGAVLSLPGVPTAFSDLTEYGPGGTVLIESTAGGVTADPASAIDVSAAGGAAAGTVGITAEAGAVSLAGAIGGAGGGGALDGNISVRAGTLADFDGLNNRLTAGGVDGSRAFEIGAGDLAITGATALAAHAISVSLDGGNLTVGGLVDASGTAPGTIALSAGGSLTVGSGAVLDAHGTVAQTDSTGATIDSENRASVTLRVADGPEGTEGAATAAAGVLTIAPGAVIDVAAAPGVVCATGACGDVELDVPRTGSATAGTVAASVPGPISVLGAGTVALNAFWTVVPAGGVVTQAVLDAAGTDATAFVAAALGGPPGADGVPTLGAPLATSLAGLAVLAPAFHLRPGIEFDSSTANGGNLTVSGDLDLSGLRTASLDPAHQLVAGAVGSGEPGVLVLRAANDLAIDGSVTDGFDQPAETAAAQNPDDEGWILETTGSTDVGNGSALPTVDVDLRVPASAGGVTLAAGTTFVTGATLDYPVTLGRATIATGTVLPAAVTLAADATLPTAVIAGGEVTDPTGAVVFARGAIIPAGTVIATGDTLAAGFVLPEAVTAASGLVWPAGAPLSVFAGGSVTTVAAATLVAGQVIPTGTKLVSGDSSGVATASSTANATIALRPDGALENGLTGQGEIFAAGAQMPAGRLSWSYDFVSGANTAAADPLAVQPASVLAAAGLGGNTVLSDYHNQMLTGPGAFGPVTAPLETFSVIRTGTGSIAFAAGGGLDESTVYGIYTAGAAPAATDGTAFDRPVGTNPVDPTLYPGYAAADAALHADYPSGGGNLAVAVQGSILSTSTTGFYLNSNEVLLPGFIDSPTGEWLFRQGNGTAAEPGAWWDNFGSYVSVASDTQGEGNPSLPLLLGFTGFGTLGGGNVAIAAGGTAGASEAQAGVAFVPSAAGILLQVLPDPSGIPLGAPLHDFSLQVTVGSTGMVDPATGLASVNGGGALTLAAGGALDPASAQGAPGSTITAMRGPATVTAASAGLVTLGDDGAGAVTDPYTVTAGYGPRFILGDANAALSTRGAIALAGVGDPTRTLSYAQGPNGDVSWFSLWDATTAVSLQSAGGDISPFNSNGALEGTNVVYPPIVTAVASSGSIVWNSSTTYTGEQVALVAAPSPAGAVNFLAAGSIIGDDHDGVTTSNRFAPAIDISGADPATLPSPADPAFLTLAANNSTGNVTVAASDLSASALGGQVIGTAENGQLFVLAPDAAAGAIHTNGAASHFYANTGDVEYLVLGQTLNYAAAAGVTPNTQYIAAMPEVVRAGNDVVAFGGTRVASTTETTTGGLLWNDEATDISQIVAGADAYFVNTQIAGPGTLEITTGGNLYQGGDGVVESIGVKTGAPGVQSNSGGASIITTTGITAANTDWEAFADLYLDPANLADPALTLAQQPGRVERTYGDELASFMAQRGYAGPASGALAAFTALPIATQEILLLQVYDAELDRSGLDYNNQGSRFFHTYAEGDEAISTLFPQTDLTGRTPATGGSITLFGGSGFRTDYGGNLEFAVPAGGFTVGVTGSTPPATAGLITQGSGDVDLYTYGSIPLGESRIFTTYGGNILIWMSSNGTVNAGEGAMSTVLFTPPDITYDDIGDITLSPTVPSTGAGIATLSPVAAVPAGDINVVTPVGTVDVGEAGIRSSGNVNVAALIVVNAANITAGGAVTGVPVVAVPNVAATAAASAAAAATTTSASASLNKAAATPTPAVITVEVTGGEGAAGAPGGDEDRRRRKG